MKKVFFFSPPPFLILACWPNSSVPAQLGFLPCSPQRPALRSPARRQPTRVSWPLLRASPASAPAQHRSNYRRSFPLSTRPHPSALPLTSSRPAPALGQAATAAPTFSRIVEAPPSRLGRYKGSRDPRAHPCCLSLLSFHTRTSHGRRKPQRQGSPESTVRPPREPSSQSHHRLHFSPL